MKKIMMLTLSLIVVFMLTGCKNDDVEKFEFNVPKAYNVNIQELGYSEYLSLSNPVVTFLHVLYLLQAIAVFRLQLSLFSPSF